VTLAYLSYGADVEISALDSASCFCVQFPLAGKARVRCGRDLIASTPRIASVPSPNEPLVMVWPAEAAHLIVRIDRGAVERKLAALLGRPVTKPIHMKLGLDLTGAAALRWSAILDLLQADIEQQGSAREAGRPVSGASAAAIQDVVLNSLLLYHPSSYSEQLARRESPARAPYVRRAIEYAKAHLDGPLTVGLLAEAAGVSVRALQAGFARDLGCSPSAYVREQRLARIREELARADPMADVRVTDVALRFGFSHLGRFAQTYYERFGELPSTTVRRSRTS
jgi:AraC-like DNA-binding protein